MVVDNFGVGEGEETSPLRGATGLYFRGLQDADDTGDAGNFGEGADFVEGGLEVGFRHLMADDDDFGSIVMDARLHDGF
jgi:hypothetical protein